jgi:putative chitinase
MDLSKLKGHVPDSVIADIPTIIQKYGIDTALKLAHFLGQSGHESGNFKVVNENLNYSGDRLKVIFPKYFKNKDVTAYNRKPEKIANVVYASRMGNGAEATGEGYKFRGRGYIQLTGKDNYKAFGASIGEDLISNPDLVSTKYALASAAWFFSKNGLCAIAEKGIGDDIITQITKRVNGGTIGLKDRIKHTKVFYNLLK